MSQQEWWIKNELSTTKMVIGENIELTANEKECFNAALIMVNKQLQNDSLLKNCFGALVAFLNTNSFTLEYAVPKQAMGQVVRLVLFPVQSWRNMRLSNRQILVSILEELCHCYYNISDEYEVKVKVHDIYRKEFSDSNITLEELYSGFNVPDSSV